MDEESSQITQQKEKDMNICVYGASSNKIDKKYIAAGEELGRLLAAAGHTLVFGGGDNGLMGAAARGVAEKGGKIIGVAPSFFNVDGMLFQNCTEFIYTETMRERKAKMEELSDAFVMTAGGIGTFEEFFEILTLKQLGRHQKPIAVLNTNGYFDSLLSQLSECVKGEFMTEKCLNLFTVCETPRDVLSALAAENKTDGIEEYKNI